MRIIARSLSLLPLAMLVACAEPATEEEAVIATEEVSPAVEAADPAAVRSEIEAVNARHVAAFNQGDIAGFAQVYTEDAQILPPDMPMVEGRQGIQEFWTGGAQQMGIRDLRLTTEEVEVFGDQAYERGTSYFMTNDGPATGKYVVIWKRTPEGWKWHRDIWNSDPAA